MAVSADPPRRPKRTTTFLIFVLAASILALILQGSFPSISLPSINLHKLRFTPRNNDHYGGHSSPPPPGGAEPGTPPAAGPFRHPPQPPPVFKDTVKSIAAGFQALIDSDRKSLDDIVARVKPHNATFANTLLPREQNANQAALSSDILTGYGSLAADKAARDASNEWQQKLQQYASAAALRQDYFELLEAVYNNKSEWAHLDHESARLLNFTYLDYRDNGLALRVGSPERRRFRELEDRIAKLENEYTTNLNEDESFVWLSREELDGAPQDLLDVWEKGKGAHEGKLKVVLRQPEQGRMMGYVKDSEVRKRVYNITNNVMPQNVPLFKEAVVLRDEKARLLGFPNHAAYKLQRKILRTPEKVKEFLREVQGRLKPKGEDELKRMTEYKRQDQKRTDKGENRFFMWDWGYYGRLMEKQYYDLDAQKVKEYFPSAVVIQGMLKIYAELFGLQFSEVKGADLDKLSPTGKGRDIIWHPDVQLFTVWNSEEEGGNFIGYLYLDIFPRDGKYGNAANFPIQKTFLDHDSGKRHFCATALVCNFPKPTEKRPSLMSHWDTVTIFHELGHGIHDLVGWTKYLTFSGNNVLADFVEAPSQMLENWAWTPEVLKNITRHYSYLSDEYKQTWLKENKDARQPEERMPDQMIERLIENKIFNVGLDNLGSIVTADFDMTLHSPATHQEILDLDPAVLWNKNGKDIGLVDSFEALIQDEKKKWTWGHGYVDWTFPHLMDGWETNYYGYMR